MISVYLLLDSISFSIAFAFCGLNLGFGFRFDSIRIAPALADSGKLGNLPQIFGADVFIRERSADGLVVGKELLLDFRLAFFERCAGFARDGILLFVPFDASADVAQHRIVEIFFGLVVFAAHYHREKDFFVNQGDVLFVDSALDFLDVVGH